MITLIHHKESTPEELLLLQVEKEQKELEEEFKRKREAILAKKNDPMLLQRIKKEAPLRELGVQLEKVYASIREKELEIEVDQKMRRELEDKYNQLAVSIGAAPLKRKQSVDSYGESELKVENLVTIDKIKELIPHGGFVTKAEIEEKWSLFYRGFHVTRQIKALGLINDGSVVEGVERFKIGTSTAFRLKVNRFGEKQTSRHRFH